MTRKRLFALLAVLCLVGFFGVILFFVPRTDLAGVFILGFLLVVYDLWTQLKSARHGISDRRTH